jgi:hypothetical protein
VEELLACGIRQRQAIYQATCYVERAGTTAYAEADAARMDAGCKMFEEVAIVGGRRYVQVAHSRVEQLQPAGIIAQHAEITIINDEIGRMRQKTKAWLGEFNSDRRPRRVRCYVFV